MQVRPGSYLGAYNAMTAKEINIFSEKVHASAFTLGSAGSFPIQFRHTCLGADTFCQGQAVITVSGNERVFLPGSGHATGCNRFLAYIGMEKTADLAFHLVL